MRRGSGPLETLEQVAAEPAEEEPEYTGSGQGRHDKLALERLGGEAAVVRRLRGADEMGENDQQRTQGFPHTASGEGEEGEAGSCRGHRPHPPALPLEEACGDRSGQFGREPQPGREAEGGESSKAPEEPVLQSRAGAQREPGGEEKPESNCRDDIGESGERRPLEIGAAGRLGRRSCRLGACRRC